MSKTSSDPRDALADMLHCLKGVFGRYSRTARKEAWDAIQSNKGRATVNKLLNSPSAPLVGVPRLLDFKEWLYRRFEEE